jgi:hypothetical protein
MGSMDFRFFLTCDHSPLLCVRMLDHEVRDADHARPGTWTPSFRDCVNSKLSLTFILSSYNDG